MSAPRQPGDGNFKRYEPRARHDGKVSIDPAHEPGPVTVLDPVTMQPIATIDSARARGRRRNVTNETLAKVKAEAGGLSWDEQEEEIRRGNSLLLSRVLSKIDAGTETTNDMLTFVKCSGTAKQWKIEARKAEPDYGKLTPEQLANIAKGNAP